MTFRNSPNINCLWGSLVIEELIRNGADFFCLSPGSRSSPLSVAVGLNPRAKSCVHFDERGAAFHALGYVSATGRPAVLISTSGTAAANFLPAVIETSKKKLPLIILTADRPPELRKTGADQTIEQVGLYGEYVRWQFDLPCPDGAISAETVLTTVDQAVHRAFGSPRGPVHLNCMFREPLAPIVQKNNFSDYLRNIRNWENGSGPYTVYASAETKLDERSGEQIAQKLNAVRNGIIVAGKLSNAKQREAVLQISEKLKWPIFPDITSGLRLGRPHKNVITYFDQILLSDRFRKTDRPDGILHLGGRITSKRWYQYLGEFQPKQYVMVNRHPLRNDPLHNVTLRVESEIADFGAAIIQKLNPRYEEPRLERLRMLSRRVEAVIRQSVERSTKLTEISVARILSENVPAQTGLFLASSMPIRDMDMYAAPGAQDAVIGANRGASGIDGTIATAAGFARGLQKPVTLVIGDLAFLHDLNSLVLLKALAVPVVVVVLNNDGGGIFSFLPISQFNKTFEKFFGTPHGIRFAHAAKLFDLQYANPQTAADFKRIYRKAVCADKAVIIEVSGDRKVNLETHRKLQDKIIRELDKVFKKA